MAYKTTAYELFGSCSYLTGDATLNMYAVNISMNEDGKNFTVNRVRRIRITANGNEFSAEGDYKLHRIYGFK